MDGEEGRRGREGGVLFREWVGREREGEGEGAYFLSFL